MQVLHPGVPPVWRAMLLLLLLLLSPAVLGSGGVVGNLADDDDDAALAFFASLEAPDNSSAPPDLAVEDLLGESANQLAECLTDFGFYSTVTIDDQRDLKTLTDSIKNELKQLGKSLDTHLLELTSHLSQTGNGSREELFARFKSLDTRCKRLYTDVHLMQTKFSDLGLLWPQKFAPNYSPLLAYVRILDAAVACLSTSALKDALPPEGSLDPFAASQLVLLFKRLVRGTLLVVCNNNALSMRILQHDSCLPPTVVSDTEQKLKVTVECLWQIEQVQTQLLTIFGERFYDEDFLKANARLLQGFQVPLWMQRLISGIHPLSDSITHPLLQFPQASQTDLQTVASSILDIPNSLTRLRISNFEITPLLPLDGESGSGDPQAKLKDEIRRARERLLPLQEGAERAAPNSIALWMIPFDEYIVSCAELILLVGRVTTGPVALRSSRAPNASASDRQASLKQIEELAQKLLKCIPGQFLALEPRATMLAKLLEIAQAMMKDPSYRPAVPLFPEPPKEATADPSN